MFKILSIMLFCAFINGRAVFCEDKSVIKCTECEENCVSRKNQKQISPSAFFKLGTGMIEQASTAKCIEIMIANISTAFKRACYHRSLMKKSKQEQEDAARSCYLLAKISSDHVASIAALQAGCLNPANERDKLAFCMIQAEDSMEAVSKSPKDSVLELDWLISALQGYSECAKNNPLCLLRGRLNIANLVTGKIEGLCERIKKEKERKDCKKTLSTYEEQFKVVSGTTETARSPWFSAYNETMGEMEPYVAKIKSIKEIKERNREEQRKQAELRERCCADIKFTSLYNGWRWWANNENIAGCERVQRNLGETIYSSDTEKPKDPPKLVRNMVHAECVSKGTLGSEPKFIRSLRD